VPPRLLRPKDEVKAALQTQMDRGRVELLEAPIGSEADYRRVDQSMRRWQNYVVDLLNTLFDENGPAEEFNRRLRVMYVAQPLQGQIDDLHRDVETLINRLQSILERVDLWLESPDAQSAIAELSDAELLRRLEPLLGEVRRQLEQASEIDPDVRADIVSDLESVEAQQHAANPNRNVIRASLNRIKENWPIVVGVAGGISVVANIISIVHGL
jgi:hypothetical protein